MSIIDQLNGRSITLRRNDGGAGAWVNGKYVPTSNTESTIIASVQPLNGKEIQLLPQGRQEVRSLKVYTEVELKTNDQLAKTQADVLIIDGIEYEVFTVMDWSKQTCIQHYECIVQMVDPQGSL